MVFSRPLSASTQARIVRTSSRSPASAASAARSDQSVMVLPLDVVERLLAGHIAPSSEVRAVERNADAANPDHVVVVLTAKHDLHRLIPGDLGEALAQGALIDHCH